MPALAQARFSDHTSAPRLETERLVLRAFEARDLDAHAATVGDPEVMHFIGGAGLEREGAWRRLLTGVGMWQLIGIGTWAVERKADGRMVGHVGFFDFNRAMEPSIAGEPEMGWIFDRSVHGQGIAREACEAALEWAQATLNVDSYPAIITPGNEASIQLAARLGFERLPDATYKGEPMALFRRPRRV